MRLIDADALYERATTLEAQALDYVGKLIERDGDETSVDWKVWSAILVERGAFKYDLMDAPTIDAVEVVRCKDCTHYGFTDNRVPKEQVWWCYKWSNVMREQDFCSYGEEKDETD